MMFVGRLSVLMGLRDGRQFRGGKLINNVRALNEAWSSDRDRKSLTGPSVLHPLPNYWWEGRGSHWPSLDANTWFQMLVSVGKYGVDVQTNCGRRLTRLWTSTLTRALPSWFLVSSSSMKFTCLTSSASPTCTGRSSQQLHRSSSLRQTVANVQLGINCSLLLLLLLCALINKSYAVSCWTATSSAEWSHYRPPSSLVRGKLLMMWSIICCLAHGHLSVVARLHFLQEYADSNLLASYPEG